MAAVRVSVEEHCVLCEVHTICQAITPMPVPVSVFVCLSKNDGLRVLKLLPVIDTCSLCTVLDKRKDQ